MSDETIVFEGETAGALRAYQDVIKADQEYLASIRRTIATADAGSKEWQQAKAKESALLRSLASDMKKVDDAHEQSKKHLKDHEGAWHSFGHAANHVLGAMGISLTVGGVAHGLMHAIELQKEWNEEVARTVRTQDGVGRKLQVQGLIKDEDFQGLLKEKIFPAAQQAAMPLASVQQIATEMVSKGFSVEEATGPALQELLLGSKATNFRGDPKDFATSIASFIKSQGQELTPENVRGVTAPLTALFQGTAFESGDLQEIAKIGALMKEFNVSQTDLFSSVTMLKDIGGAQPQEAVTGTRNMAMILAGSGAGRAKELLDSLGEAVGRPDLQQTVDLVGESFPQALQNLKDAMDALPEEKRHAFMADLFGKRTAAQAQTLLNNIDRYEKLAAVQRDTSKFETGVGIATQGPAAGEVRAANELAMAKLSQEKHTTMEHQFLQARNAELIERGMSPWKRELYLQYYKLRFGAGYDPHKELENLKRSRPELGAQIEEKIHAQGAGPA